MWTGDILGFIWWRSKLKSMQKVNNIVIGPHTIWVNQKTQKTYAYTWYIHEQTQIIFKVKTADKIQSNGITCNGDRHRIQITVRSGLYH